MGSSRDCPFMKTVIIDCAGVTSTDEFWRRYVDAVQPEGREQFGCNLDAFWDALEGGGHGWPGDVTLDFQHTNALSELLTAGGGSLLDGLRKIGKEVTGRRLQLS